MDYPTFTYHPNAYDLNIFIQELGICEVCGKQRDLKYTCSFYAVTSPSIFVHFALPMVKQVKSMGANLMTTAVLKVFRLILMNLNH